MAPAHLPYKRCDPAERRGNESVAQRDSVYRQNRVSAPRQFQDLSNRLSGDDSDARGRETIPDGFEGRQAKYDIAQLAKVNRQNIARVEAHRLDQAAWRLPSDYIRVGP